MLYKGKQYAWVNEVDGVKYYRSLTDPKDEIQVDGDTHKKTSKKIKDIIGDVRVKNPKTNRKVK